jgi:hypothetical protein
MSIGFVGRRRPYTAIGIGRKKCCRCGEKAVYQWNCCANGNWWVPLCVKCDVAINRVMLRFMRHPNERLLMERYKLKVAAK